METEAGAKTRRLILILEILALLVSGLLVLIDYRLKQDLLALFKRIESALETADGIFGKDPDVSSDTGDIPRGFVVGDNTIVETPASNSARAANGASRSAANKRATSNGGGRTRNTQVSESGKPVGP